MAAEGGRPYSSLQQVSPRRRRGDQNEILKGKTVLHHVVQGEKLKMVSWLLDHGEDINGRCYNAP